MKQAFKTLTICFLLTLISCRGDDIIFIPEEVPVTSPEEDSVSSPEYTSIKGFYLLNEGNMGSNKATLDYYDYTTGVYTRNIYGNANPDVPKEMGDVGNDLKIYGSRLYAVINCSNKVEVMNSQTAKRIGQIEIPNCRYIRFYEGYAYVTSYAGPVVIKPDYEQLGYVAKIDTATLQEVDRCIVGFQPDELEISEGYIYVANSGGYMVPRYENTISVIDIASFKEVERIEIDINLHRIRADKYGQLWISSRGDYFDNNSKLYCYDTRKQRITAKIDVPVSNMHLDGDSLFIVSAQWNYVSMSNEITNAIIDVKRREKVCDNFIKDGTDNQIKIPYGIMVNPHTKDIYVTDAKNYVNPGYLHCYSQDGIKKWSVRTGDVPAHFVFLGENINEQ